MQNVKSVKIGKRTRYSFGKINEVMQMPNLIEVQKASYEWFMTTGLKEAFRDLDEIKDYSGNLVLSFGDYYFVDKPKYSVKECKERNSTYAIPLYLSAKLKNNQTGEVKQNDSIYMGDFPKMTDAGTFIINGAERAVVSQLVRSPGAYFAMTRDKLGTKLFSSTIIPTRGAWLEYETDQNNLFYVRIDKNKKLPVTTFIKSLGLGSDEEIKAMFGEDDRIVETLSKDAGIQDTTEALLEVYKKLRPAEPPTVDTAKSYLNALFFDDHRYDLSRVGRYKYNKKLGLTDRLPGHILAEPVVSEITGEVLAEAGEKVTRELAYAFEQAGVKSVALDVDGITVKVVSNGMADILPFLPEGFTAEELEEVGVNEKVSVKVLTDILGRNEGLGHDELLAVLAKEAVNLVPRHITIDDIFASISYLCNSAYGVGSFDDIDHLGNRRIRSVGELLQNQFRIGLAHLEKNIRDKMTTHTQDLDKVTPQSLINIRAVTSAVKEFFGSSPLSQFMDQTNPLSELTNKRRLSALGPGGLSRERASFQVRDVHYTHYGRMCPIESPEGQNIGLISSLATFARINKYGFIEAPFRKVDKETGKVLDEVVYMTADTEDEFYIAQANEPLDENGFFVNDRVVVRYKDEFLEIDKDRADYMDVSPKMVVSAATAMIPFLEHDDANRALMAANMQRQAVPLLKTEPPIVATGMEYKAAVDSGVCVLAKRAGIVTKVDASICEVLTDDGETDTYEFVKFTRSNQGTCINQKPIVKPGERVEKDQVLADGPATNGGEISLGKNVLIGFMTWEGYNYEDAVLINEKIVRDDVYTSIHIEKYEIEARETKLGPEEITNDIPNVGDDVRKDLDANGIIRIGAEVHSGDILVGKVTPKAEPKLNAEEKLLHTIFGEKAREVRDTSLRVPHGQYGIVVNVETYTRENSDELSPGVNKIVRVYIAQKRKISIGDKMAGRHGNKGVVSRILPQEDMPFLADGTPLDIVLNPLGVPSRMNIGQVLEVNLGRACREIGIREYGDPIGHKIMTPVFDGAGESDIVEYFKEAGLPENGKFDLYDGRTGRKFDNPVTVGVMYFLKLHHLVDDKIHARSIGPYALVTQQPLGGKAQFGGQRFGEMEVWALEAYGAAYTLQEILTIKSDDVVGRVKTYEAIVKGMNIPAPGIPESFKVLVKELQALALDIRVFDDEGIEIDLNQTYDEEPNGDYTALEELNPEFTSVDDEDAYSDAGYSVGMPDEIYSDHSVVYDDDDDDFSDDKAVSLGDDDGLDDFDSGDFDIGGYVDNYDSDDM